MATKVTAKAASKEVALVTVPAAVKSALGTAVNADTNATIAITASAKTLVVLGEVVRKEMGKNPYETTRLSLKPLMLAEYAKANAKLPKPRDEKTLSLYVGEQLSRTMGVAYPGGPSVTKPEDRKTFLANGEAALKAGLAVNKVYRAFKGTIKPNKKGEWAEVKVSTRGGKNRIAPLDAFAKGFAALASAAKQGKITVEQMLNKCSDVWVDLDLIEDGSELADMLKD